MYPSDARPGDETGANRANAVRNDRERGNEFRSATWWRFGEAGTLPLLQMDHSDRDGVIREVDGLLNSGFHPVTVRMVVIAVVGYFVVVSA